MGNQAKYDRAIAAKNRRKIPSGLWFGFEVM
jgi:hypothetical protein